MLLFHFFLTNLLICTNAAGSDFSYDDFSSPKLDSAKWRYLEFVREIQNGRFVSAIRSRGRNQSAAIKAPGTPSSIEASVVLKETSGAGVRQSAARIGLHAFNDGSAGPTGDDTGEIWAQVGIGLFDGVLDSRWKVERRIASDGRWETLGEGSLGDIQKDVPYILSVTTNRDTGTAFFSIDGVAAEFSLGREAKAPQHAYFSVGCSNQIEQPDLTASVRAEFDAVKVNGYLYDDFSTNRLCRNKWYYGEYLTDVIEPGNGKCRFKTENLPGRFSSPSLIFIDPEPIVGIRFDGTVMDSESDEKALVRLRAAGNFYRTSGDSDVSAEIGIGDLPGDGTGQLKAYCMILDKRTMKEYAFYEFGNVAALTAYTIGLQYLKPDRFTFTLDGKSRTLTGPSHHGPPLYALREIGARISSMSKDGVQWRYEPEGSGFIEARADNAVISNE